MERLLEKQKKCILTQNCLTALTVIFFKYGVFPLFAHAFLIIVYGNILTNKATSLARKKYPYIPIGPSGKGLSWDPYISAEARSLDDYLTADILKFNRSCILHFFAAMAGYIFMLVVFGEIVMTI